MQQHRKIYCCYQHRRAYRCKHYQRTLRPKKFNRPRKNGEYLSRLIVEQLSDTNVANSRLLNNRRLFPLVLQAKNLLAIRVKNLPVTPNLINVPRRVKVEAQPNVLKMTKWMLKILKNFQILVK